MMDYSKPVNAANLAEALAESRDPGIKLAMLADWAKAQCAAKPEPQREKPTRETPIKKKRARKTDEAS